jgi:hypothetical protein
MASILPTRGGFFFGSTNYDMYYIQDMEETVRILTEALKLPESTEFIYQSDW